MIPCDAYAQWCEYQGKRYAQGLGFVTVLDDVSYNPQFCYNELVHYRKGTEAWGTPLNFSLITGESEIKKNDQLTITPNPIYNSCVLDGLPHGEVEITIYNSLGEIVEVQMHNSSESLLIQANEWKAGIYFVHIISANGINIQKLIKL
jgi:hypothetical protein